MKKVSLLLSLVLSLTCGLASAENKLEVRERDNTFDGFIDASNVWQGVSLAGNAGTATALAADPSDCSANQFANAIVASGNLSCAALTDADVPNSITVDLAATATALAANPTDCAANQFANAIVASGNLTCAAIADADVPNNITVDLAATATALAANGGNCSAGQSPLGVDASGAVEGCFDVQTGAEATTHAGLPSVHHTATVDTNANTICSGTSVYLDGEGNCDTLSISTNNEGSDTTANICTTTPAAAGNFMTSTDDYDLYTATGTAIGQWRNGRTGIGACL